MIVAGIILLGIGIFLFLLGYGSLGALLTFTPSLIIGVAGLALLIVGIAKLFQSESETVNPETENVEQKNNENSIYPEESGKSNASLIREYKQLVDDGIITEEEFEEKKRKLLNADD